jgi:hypothetical protein
MITTDGENKMSDGFSTNDAVLWGAMNNMGNRRGGDGAWGNGDVGFGAQGPWAGPTERTVNQQSSCINGTLESLTRTLAMDAINKNVSDGFSRACDKAEAVAVRNSDQLYGIARDLDNKFSKVTEQNHGIALAMKDQEIRNVERYCELKSGQATIEAKVDANQKFNELFSENQSLKTQVACGCTTGCTQRCHDHHGRG